MNPDSGRLVADIESEPEEKRRNFVPVPASMRHAAKKALSGRASTMVDLGSDTPLAHFAKRQRKAKTRRKNAKASRKASR